MITMVNSVLCILSQLKNRIKHTFKKADRKEQKEQNWRQKLFGEDSQGAWGLN